MPFQHDSRGVDPDDFPILPDGWYPFKIFDAEESKSKKGLPMVVVKSQVFNDPRYSGQSVWNFIVFLPKDRPGAGISVHFRKCIGVPFGGDDIVDASEWIGKKFMGEVIAETYEGKRRNKFAKISPYDETLIKHENEDNKPTEDVPF